MTALSLKLLREIGHLRGQLIAIILVIGCGIGTYVMSRSMHASLLLTQEAYYAKGRYADVFATVQRAPRSVVGELQSIRGVALAEARTTSKVLVDVPGLAEPATATLVSMPSDRPMLMNDVHLVSGRRIAPGAFDEVVLYAPFAEANGLTVGDTIAAVLNGRWRKLAIVGTAISPEFVIVLNPGTLMLDNKRIGVMWMAEEAVQAAFDMQGACNSLVLKLYAGASVSDVCTQVDRVLDRHGGWGAQGRDDQPSHRFLSDEIKQLEVTAIIIPLIFLGVAIFLLNIALTRLVATQRGTIAILKAFGYGNIAIAVHYVGFAVVSVAGGTIVGIVIGYVLGVNLAELYMEFYRFPMLVFRLPWDVISVVVLMSLAAAVAGALLAVRSAVRLPPADAMRPPSPRTFQAGALERLGVAARLGPVPLMIARNIERRALRSAVAIFMIALATSILVLGRFMFDVMDRMLAISFDVAQHEDVTLTLSKPLSGHARYDIAQLPGVVRVEPFRMTAVDVLHGRYRHQTVMTSVAQDQELRRPTDVWGNRAGIPGEGVVLTEYLAKKLNCAIGDTVSLALKEGRRDTMRAVVSGTVKEFIGAQVYASPQTMSRLLREQGSVSGAYLDMENDALADFLLAAKRTPMVAGTLVRSVALQSFRDVYVQNIWMTTTYIVVLSCVIAFGVVYNSARIALSERGTELASLRILGMTTREISIILLGEQAVFTLLAIPIGAGIGYALCSWIVQGFETEYLRLVFVFSPSNVAISASIILGVAIMTSVLMYRRLVRLDLIGVLKSRE
ncbi:MAG: FtsX-like permease family protein [Candidatus Kapabacteria bacterium]|nr:FtsX-like permease family protein [Candidatus Kapabacteria bacterium]